MQRLCEIIPRIGHKTPPRMKKKKMEREERHARRKPGRETSKKRTKQTEGWRVLASDFLLSALAVHRAAEVFLAAGSSEPRQLKIGFSSPKVTVHPSVCGGAVGRVWRRGEQAWSPPCPVWLGLCLWRSSSEDRKRPGGRGTMVHSAPVNACCFAIGKWARGQPAGIWVSPS